MNVHRALTPQADTWEDQAAEWVKQNISAELLDAWLFEPDGGGLRSFDDVWVDLKRARMMILCVDPRDAQHAMLDLYCASYRWHLACANPTLSAADRHHQAMICAVAEVHATEQSAPHALHHRPQGGLAAHG